MLYYNLLILRFMFHDNMNEMLMMKNNMKIVLMNYQ